MKYDGKELADLFKLEDIIENTDHQLIVKEGSIIKVINFIGGKPRSMWYHDMETYLDQKQFFKEADNTFSNIIMWGKGSKNSQFRMT